jgi:hypothetical protein
MMAYEYKVDNDASREAIITVICWTQTKFIEIKNMLNNL